MWVLVGWECLSRNLQGNTSIFWLRIELAFAVKCCALCILAQYWGLFSLFVVADVSLPFAAWNKEALFKHFITWRAEFNDWLKPRATPCLEWVLLGVCQCKSHPGFWRTLNFSSLFEVEGGLPALPKNLVTTGAVEILTERREEGIGLQIHYPDMCESPKMSGGKNKWRWGGMWK